MALVAAALALVTGCVGPAGPPPQATAPTTAARRLPWMEPVTHPAPDAARVYECRRVASGPRVDGFLDDAAWDQAAPAQPLVDVLTGEPFPLRTRFRAIRDDEALYLAISAEEPDVWGRFVDRDSELFQENNLEVFFDPAGDGRDYVELEYNALNTVWDLVMDRSYGDGGTPDTLFTLPGLEHAIQVYGTLNHGGDRDEGWTLEVGVPWAGLARAGHGHPPAAGTEWPFNVTRVEWKRVLVGPDWVRDPEMDLSWEKPEGPHESNASWAVVGRIHFHLLDRWGRLRFVD